MIPRRPSRRSLALSIALGAAIVVSAALLAPPAEARDWTLSAQLGVMGPFAYPSGPFFAGPMEKGEPHAVIGGFRVSRRLDPRWSVELDLSAARYEEAIPVVRIGLYAPGPSPMLRCDAVFASPLLRFAAKPIGARGVTPYLYAGPSLVWRQWTEDWSGESLDKFVAWRPGYAAGGGVEWANDERWSVALGADHRWAAGLGERELNYAQGEFPGVAAWGATFGLRYRL
jgi:hypothetical protein